jgi:hypothetical protein
MAELLSSLFATALMIAIMSYGFCWISDFAFSTGLRGKFVKWWNKILKKIAKKILDILAQLSAWIFRSFRSAFVYFWKKIKSLI